MPQFQGLSLDFNIVQLELIYSVTVMGNCGNTVVVFPDLMFQPRFVDKVCVFERACTLTPVGVDL